MKHDAIRHKLSEYIDGTVNEKEKAEIEEHLKTCSKCSDALGELRKTIEQIKQVEDLEPPAWLTQNIMARVREESERRAGIWNKLLFPLRMRPAISAVAVLFLAVTAFYIYQNIRPEMKFAEAPMDTFAKREAPSAGLAQDKAGRVEEYRQQPKQAPQEPGYKALDMKLEYEKPAPLVPKEQATAPAAAAAAPSSAKPAEQAFIGENEVAVTDTAQEKTTESARADQQPKATDKMIGREKSSIESRESEQPAIAAQRGLSSIQQYPVPEEYVPLIIDKSKKLVATWTFPGTDVPPGEMYFYNNGLLVLDSVLFSKNKEKRYLKYAFSSDRVLITITFIDNRIQFDKDAKADPNYWPIAAIDASKREVTYRVDSHHYYKEGITFLGFVFADWNKK